MSETASGLARVAALLLATTMFAVVWNGDQQTQQQFIVARKAAAQHAREVLLAESRREILPTPATSASIMPTVAAQPASPSVPAEQSYVARVEVEMELPAGITTGRYRVVDQSGAIETIHVTAGRPSHRDLFVLEGRDGSRRFFIRVTDPAQETRTANRESDVTR